MKIVCKVSTYLGGTVHRPGTEIDLPEADAKVQIARGFAEAAAEEETVEVQPGDLVGIVHTDVKITDGVVTEDGGVEDLGTEVDLEAELEGEVEVEQERRLTGAEEPALVAPAPAPKPAAPKKASSKKGK